MYTQIGCSVQYCIQASQKEQQPVFSRHKKLFELYLCSGAKAILPDAQGCIQHPAHLYWGGCRHPNTETYISGCRQLWAYQIPDHRGVTQAVLGLFVRGCRHHHKRDINFRDGNVLLIVTEYFLNQQLQGCFLSKEFDIQPKLCILKTADKVEQVCQRCYPPPPLPSCKHRWLSVTKNHQRTTNHGEGGGCLRSSSWLTFPLSFA